MATTKKTAAAAASNSAKGQSAKAATRTLPTKPVAPAKSAADLKAAAALEAAVTQARAALQTQMKQWEQAMQLFSQKKFGQAHTRFTEAAGGPAAHIADKARSYAQICERKMNSGELHLSTADDHFNYGVERLNARDIEAARNHLDRALAMEPNAEHILFTLALCCGMAGDASAACENLRRAIDLEPKNKILARQDPEFLALAQQIPALRAVLMTETADSN
jgi:tetratricopeptide (TPR) repeat protein